MQKDVEEILLKIENLYIKYVGNPDKKYAVNDFSMELRNGEIVGILGESGAGKSSVGMGILSMIDPPNELSGHIFFRGKDIGHMNAYDLSRYKWNQVSMVFQSAMNILDPVINIEQSITELLLDKSDLNDRIMIKERVRELIDLVELPENTKKMFPFELSGGMKQRVAIAMAIAN